MKAILVHQTGGPEQMQWEEIPTPTPGPGQVLIKIAVSGVNFIDTYFRTGLYKSDFPIAIGQEAAGTVAALGPDVADLQIGDSVAYAMSRGSYAEYAVVPAWQVIKTPTGLAPHLAAAVMLQGMTAHYLTHSAYALKPGDTCLIHAAAGGTGLLLVQMAKALGARVIGTVGTPEKAELAKHAGADHIILYEKGGFEAETKKFTENRGVDVVYDAVGKAVFHESLNCLRPRGMMVTFGNASGAVPPIEPLLLNQKGSLFLTRPTLAHYTATREELLTRATDVLTAVTAGRLDLRIHQTYPIAAAATAHRDLESRRTSGKLLLEVSTS